MSEESRSVAPVPHEELDAAYQALWRTLPPNDLRVRMTDAVDAAIKAIKTFLETTLRDVVDTDTHDEERNIPLRICLTKDEWNVLHVLAVEGRLMASSTEGDVPVMVEGVIAHFIQEHGHALGALLDH